MCNYSDPATGANVVVTLSQETNASISEVEASASSQAKTLGAPLSSLPGLGEAAFFFTQDDASENVNGVPTITIVALKEPFVVNVTADLSQANAENVARYALSLV